jgi:hypothetical protein
VNVGESTVEKVGKIESAGFFDVFGVGALSRRCNFVQGKIEAGQGRCGDYLDFHSGNFCGLLRWRRLLLGEDGRYREKE